MLVKNKQMDKLDGGGDWSLWFSLEGRTAHPYLAEAWGEGHVNFPPIDLVAAPEGVDSIPEVQKFAALREVLLAANIAGGQIQSTQSDCGIVERADGKKSAGAIFHLAFRDEGKNRTPVDLVQLAYRIESNLSRPSSQFSIRFTVEPYKSWHGKQGYWGLAVEFSGVGSDEASAWDAANEAAQVVATSLSELVVRD